MEDLAELFVSNLERNLADLRVKLACAFISVCRSVHKAKAVFSQFLLSFRRCVVLG